MNGIYLMILLLSSVMAMHFFHWVTTVGSWLDIGMSISHYVIVQLKVLFVMALHSVVKLLTHGPIYFRGSSKYDKD
jgi:GPI ethanolamine phosphate transferase 1